VAQELCPREPDRPRGWFTFLNIFCGSLSVQYGCCFRFFGTKPKPRAPATKNPKTSRYREKAHRQTPGARRSRNPARGVMIAPIFVPAFEKPCSEARALLFSETIRKTVFMLAGKTPASPKPRAVRADGRTWQKNLQRRAPWTRRSKKHHGNGVAERGLPSRSIRLPTKKHSEGVGGLKKRRPDFRNQHRSKPNCCCSGTFNTPRTLAVPCNSWLPPRNKQAADHPTKSGRQRCLLFFSEADDEAAGEI